MLRGLLILLLISANLGGVFSVIMQLGRGEVLAALGSAAFVLLLDGLGAWLLREGPGAQ